MRVAIAGGNGFIGRAITEVLAERGDEVVWLSHRPGRTGPPGRPSEEVSFDHADMDGPWVRAITEADALVNLSGYPISARWDSRVKRLLVSTRVDLTRHLVEAMRQARKLNGRGPSVFVNASGAGYYGDRGDDLLPESEPAGADWLARLAEAWESEAMRAAEAGVRAAVVRTSAVMGDKGVLPLMTLAHKFFVGGPLGKGDQWFPWIHHADIAGIYVHIIDHPTLSGAVNGVSPQQLRMSEFSRILGGVLSRPSWLHVPRVGLRILLGELADYSLMSQRVEARAAMRSGYAYGFPSAEEALRDLLVRR